LRTTKQRKKGTDTTRGPITAVCSGKCLSRGRCSSARSLTFVRQTGAVSALGVWVVGCAGVGACVSVQTGDLQAAAGSWQLAGAPVDVHPLLGNCPLLRSRPCRANDRRPSTPLFTAVAQQPARHVATPFRDPHQSHPSNRRHHIFIGAGEPGGRVWCGVAWSGASRYRAFLSIPYPCISNIYVFLAINGTPISWCDESKRRHHSTR
jgi:hypothetical protein